MTTITVQEVEEKAAQIANNIVDANKTYTESEIKRLIVDAFRPGVDGLREVNVQLSEEVKTVSIEKGRLEDLTMKQGNMITRADEFLKSFAHDANDLSSSFGVGPKT